MIFLLDLPGPVHGMSNVNLAFLKLCQKRFSVKIINTVPSYLSVLFGGIFWGVTKFMHTLFCFFKLVYFLIVDVEKVVYRPINGGMGQVYDIVYVVLCRIFNAKVYIHHHSFNYLSKYSLLFNLLIRFAGDNVKHIVLGHEMALKLMQKYKVEEIKIFVVSNIAFFDGNELDSKKPEDTIVIGYLSNLCLEKGIDTVAYLFKSLANNGIKFKGLIAGPISDDKVKFIINDLVTELDNVDYIGGVYSEDKDEFFKSLDIFLFPSRYKNEAEPLVLYEAAKYGALVLGSQQGCMREVIDRLGGYSFPIDQNWLGECENIINELFCANEVFKGRKIRRRLFLQLKNTELTSLDRLVNLLESDCVPEIK